MTEELEGKITGITFFNPLNHYTIAKLKTSLDKNISILGNFPSLNKGESLKVRGYWKEHEKFGSQFMVESFEFINPDSLEDIIQYLSSGLFEAIKPKLAKKIVNSFGSETIAILDSNIERLSEITRISNDKIQMIKSEWDNQREFRRAILFLQSAGIASTLAIRIFSLYGKGTEALIKDNPYRILNDFPEVGFGNADIIAFKIGFTELSNIRIEAGIVYLLKKLADDGHTFYPKEALIHESAKSLNTNYDIVADSLHNMLRTEILIEEELSSSSAIEPFNGVFLSELYFAEVYISEKLIGLKAESTDLKKLNQEKLLCWIEKEIQISLAEMQKKAVLSALDNKISVITGGPGTGKTTIINSILRVLKRFKKKFLLAAPTGRAAKRITETTGNEAKTIHRLLEYSPTERCFGKNEDNLLDADYIIVDECSMIDTALFKSLLIALPEKCSLILVGDADQLPSIGPGNILRDIIESEAIPTIHLDEIFRQSKGSLIVLNSHSINKGEMPKLYEENNEDFHFLNISEPEKALAAILTLCGKTMPDELKIDPLKDVQVLSPMHKGINGVANLNIELQTLLNPSEEEIKFGEKVFKSGDKVMQNKNNYQKDIYNGDIGLINSIDFKKKIINVNFEGRFVKYEYIELEELILAYAISVHKAQGSEYSVVIIPVLQEHYRMLQRNLLYTAITRGKKMVILVGTEKMISAAVRNNRSNKRYTSLKERLKQGIC
ncbi:MAG: ATP-dependent RecD-like DNA helicase [Ignavibacteria bacterium]